VSDFEAVSSANGITLTWVIAASGPDPSDRITVRRAEAPEGPFTDLATLSPAGSRSMRYDDVSAVPGRVYWYALFQGAKNQEAILAGPIRATASLEFRTRLGPLRDPGGDRPVPVHYTLGGQRARAVLAIYDVAGRLVRVLDDAVRDPGEHEVSWDRLTGDGNRSARGLYFVRLVSAGADVTGKLVLLH
jgi:hypothetical protein